MKSAGKKKSNETVSPALKQEFRKLASLIEDENRILTILLNSMDMLKKPDFQVEMFKD